MADTQPTIVTVDDGTSVVKAVKDASGRIITATQVQLIRTSQQRDLEKVTTLRDQLVAGEAGACDLVINQARDEIERRLALLELQKTDLQNSLAKIKAGDPAMRQDILEKMTARLNARVTIMTDSRDRSDLLIAQMQSTDPVKVIQPPVEVGG